MSNIIGDYFKNFSKEQKEAVIAILVLIGLSDGESNENNKELVYTEFYRKHLNVEINCVKEKIAKSQIYNLINYLSSCSDEEKAILIFICRGMANIDSEANDSEIKIIDQISKQLRFDLDKYYSDPNNRNRSINLDNYFKLLIFPNGLEDIEQGGEILNHFLNTKVDQDHARRAYIEITVSFQLAQIQSVQYLEDKLKRLMLDILPANLEVFYKFLRGRILLRMNKDVQ